MRLLGLAGLAGACLATSQVYAADLFGSAPPPMDAPSAQTELGSNWYIRGDIGYGQTNQTTVDPNGTLFPTVYQGGYTDPNTKNWVNTTTFNGAPTGSPTGNTAFTRGNAKTVTTPDFSLGFGYRVNDWLRVEATYQMSQGPGVAAQTQVKCVTALTAANNYDAATGAYDIPVGYTATTRPCNGYLNARQYNNTGMASVIADLGHWWILNPFIGVGLGVNASTITGSTAFYDSVTGAAYTGVNYAQGNPEVIAQPTNNLDVKGNPVLTTLQSQSGVTPQGLFTGQNWNRNLNSTKYTIAGQLMAGVGVPISQSATMDLTYKMMSLDLFGSAKNMRQSVSLGVRYNIN
jgi:hypothetical protein